MTDAEVMLLCFKALIEARVQAGVDSPCHRRLKRILGQLKAGRRRAAKGATFG